MEEVGVSGRISSPVSRDYKIWPEGARGGFVPPSRALLDNRLALYVKPVEKGGKAIEREREREKSVTAEGERGGRGGGGEKKEERKKRRYPIVMKRDFKNGGSYGAA